MIRTFRIGDPPRRGEGLRVAVVRRPPRGIRRERWPELFDVWFPAIAPSAALLAQFRSAGAGDAQRFERFAAAYARQLETPEARQTVDLLAALALRTRIAIGCYCEDERRCHRSVLRRFVDERMRERQRIGVVPASALPRVRPEAPPKRIP
jgi:uncharacterized protein YeaO (DUF488 family)